MINFQRAVCLDFGCLLSLRSPSSPVGRPLTKCVAKRCQEDDMEKLTNGIQSAQGAEGDASRYSKIFKDIDILDSTCLVEYTDV